MKTINSFRIAANLLVSLSILLLASCDTSTTNPAPLPVEGPILLVANHADGAGNMSLIELESGAIISEAAGIGIYSNDIVEFEDQIYVINSGSNDMNVLNILENNTLEADTVITFGSGNPMNGAVADNGYLYISNKDDNNVFIYDIRRSRILAYLPVGKSPADVIITNDKVYVCNTGVVVSGFVPGTLSLIPLSTGLVDTTISVGFNPQYMAIDPNGRLHVVCSGYDWISPHVDGEIHIINTDADTVESFVYIGGQPREIAITYDGFAYVTASGSVDQGFVYRYNAFTGEILNGQDNPIEVGMGAYSIVADVDGAVYVGCFSDDSVYKIYGEDVVDIIYNVGDQPATLHIYRR